MAELTRPDVEPPTGPAPEDLVIEDIVVGDGPEATPGSLVSAHYVGVTHDSFGLGTVTATRGSGDSTQAEVDFGSGTGVKWLLLRYAPLEKL